MKKVFIFLLTVMLFAASCRETDEYLPLSPQEDAVYYQTVPYSITVGITPMTEEQGHALATQRGILGLAW